jgi:hypothetical protein
MAGQSNIFNKPDTTDPFGASTPDFQGGIYQGKEKRPNVDPKQKQQSQAEWEKSINGPQNKIK